MKKKIKTKTVVKAIVKVKVKPKEKVDDGRFPNQTMFACWFADEFWRISGELILPTRDELKELSENVYKKLVLTNR